MKRLYGLVLMSVVVTACGSDAIDSDEEARRAYLGLDDSIAKSITLGFAGFNTASSANISPQTAPGTLDGDLTVTGQVDQGSSNNKGMRLHVGMVAYTDGKIIINDKGDTISVTYDTDADPTLQPFLSMQLKNIPTGTLDGTLMGTYHMAGDIKGDATLDITFTGTLQDSGGTVVRVPGSTTVTGSLTTPNDGLFMIELTI
jgi:hypothetical protein